MTEKEIISEINKEIRLGKPKSSLYDQFKDEIKDETLRKNLASRPSNELRQKHKKAHLFISLIWGFFILFELAGIYDLIVAFDFKVFISLILSIYITINIWKFDGRFLLVGIIWFSFTIIRSFNELNAIYEFDPDYHIILIFVIIYVLILAIGVYLMYYVKKNVFSYIKWFQPIIDREGNIQFE